MNFVMTEEKVTRTYKAELEGFNYRVNKEIKDEKSNIYEYGYSR